MRLLRSFLRLFLRPLFSLLLVASIMLIAFPAQKSPVAATAVGQRKAASAPAATWRIESLEPVVNLSTISLAIDSQGWPHVSYVAPGNAQNGFNSSVWYGYKDPSGWHYQIISAFANEVVMRLDSADRPHVAFYGYASQALCEGVCYAAWNGSAWQFSQVDGLGKRVFDLALDDLDRPQIAYYQMVDEYKIMYARRLTDDSWHTERIATVGEGVIVLNSAISLAIDRSEQPFVFFYRYGTQPVIASPDNSNWLTEVIEESSIVSQNYNGLAFDAANQAHVAYTYWTNEVRYAHPKDNEWQIESVEIGGIVGQGLALALDGAGRPHLSHCLYGMDAHEGEVHYDYYDGANWQREVAYVGDRCERTKLAIDNDGRAHIAFIDNADGRLKLLYREAGDLVRVDPTDGGIFTYVDPQNRDTVIYAPGGAVTETTDLLFTPITTTVAPANFAFAGHAFSLTAYQDGRLQAGFTFATPVTVTVQYSPADVAVVDSSALALMYWNGNTWVDATTTCSPASTYVRHPEDHWLSAPICHLSQFALFGPTHNTFLPITLRARDSR